jgi:hypothetical protein
MMQISANKKKQKSQPHKVTVESDSSGEVDG